MFFTGGRYLIVHAHGKYILSSLLTIFNPVFHSVNNRKGMFHSVFHVANTLICPQSTAANTPRNGARMYATASALRELTSLLLKKAPRAHACGRSQIEETSEIKWTLHACLYKRAVLTSVYVIVCLCFSPALRKHAQETRLHPGHAPNGLRLKTRRKPIGSARMRFSPARRTPPIRTAAENPLRPPVCHDMYVRG
jgi:hypothetical protein